MIKWVKRLVGDRRGNVLAIAGAALPLLVGAAGLATDTINWTLWKRELQRAADSAAIAGVYERVNGASDSEAEAAVEHDLTINQQTGMALVSGYPDVTFPGDSGQMRDQVEVVLAVKKRLPFSSLFLSEPPTIIATARAATVPIGKDPCVQAQETNPSKTGIKITGNAHVSMPDCTLHSNSPSSNNSAAATGSGEVYADTVAAVGGIQQSINWHVNSYDPYAPPIEDPFKSVTPDPNDMKCAGEWVTKGPNTEWVPAVLDENTDMANAKDADGNKANCFESLSVGSNTTLSIPADYGPVYINGGDAFIQGDISCTGCTIVLTNKDSASNDIGEFKVNADAKINLTAPTTGTFKGIAIYQDRRAQDSSSAQNKINGNSESVITGAIYFPNQELDYNGTGNTSAVCTMFVARRIIFSGNGSTSNKFKSRAECALTGLPASSSARRVRLVA
jgi:Flp pilus assembly protein TadG